MSEEVLVLRGEKSLYHALRDLFVADRVAAFLAELRDQAVVGAVYSQRHLEPHLAEVVYGRDLVAKVEIDAGGHSHGHQGARQQRQ